MTINQCKSLGDNDLTGRMKAMKDLESYVIRYTDSRNALPVSFHVCR